VTGLRLESATAGELTEFRRKSVGIVFQSFNLLPTLTVLLFISLLIAALGEAITLRVLVLERARQFQTMMATGASAAQIRAVIGWEAVMMVVLGEVLGLACGFVLSVLLIFVINKRSFG